MTRRIFYSFHYDEDSHRAQQVRNIGALDGNIPATKNQWETVKQRGDNAIQNWILDNLKNRSCTVVLVGAQTAKRKWIDFEIIESWKRGMGVAALRVHGLKNLNGHTSSSGANPFAHMDFGTKKFSDIVEIYDPVGPTSTDRYAWIRHNLPNIIDRAIYIRNKN